MPDSDICLPLRKNAWANGSNSKARHRKYVRPILKYVRPILKYVRPILKYVRHIFYLLQSV